MALICRHAPASADASVAEFARHATHSQLSRVLSKYVFESDEKTEPEPERRRVDFGHDDDGWWRCWGVLGSEEGAKVQRAMELERERRKLDSWADALVAVAERCLAADHATRGHHDAQTVVVHVRQDGGGHLHLGPGLPDAVLRHLGCDGRVKTLEHDHRGVALSVGRASRIVPERTRLAIEERDRGCRVPGCDHTAWLQVHHIVHWLDGGPTDTWNLVALCSHHHRLHHQGNFQHRGQRRRSRRPDLHRPQGPPAHGLWPAGAPRRHSDHRQLDPTVGRTPRLVDGHVRRGAGRRLTGRRIGSRPCPTLSTG